MKNVARLPQTKRLDVADYPDKYQDLLLVLLPQLSQFMESVYNAMNKDLSFSDNVNGQLRELRVTGGTVPVSFKTETRGRPRGVWVIDVQPVDGASGSTVGSPVTVEWEYVPQTSQVRLKAIHGLTSGTKYRLTVAVLGS